MSGGTIGLTALQAAWLPTRQAVDSAIEQLDVVAYAEYLELLATLTARLHAERWSWS
jgi:hypothetical protein